MAADTKFLRKKIKAGRIDVHPIETAIVVYYEIEAIIIDEYGQPVIGDAKEATKIIRVPNLAKTTNLSLLAQTIIKQCKLIHESKILEVEQLLAFLKKRELSGKAFKPSEKSMQLKINEEEKASLNEIDHYIECLYEDKEKVRGTKLILQLASNPDNLEAIALNEPLMKALTRIFQEDSAKLPAAVTNIIHMFYFFSMFSQFHEIIAQHKIGSACIAIISQVIKKFEVFRMSIEKKAKALEAKKITQQEYDTSVSPIIEEEFSQESFVFVALHLLLNIAEDARVEIKMVNKGITGLLVSLLDRDNAELLTLVVKFLKKLSLYKENKDQMIEQGVILKLVRFIPNPNEVFLNMALRLLFNLSFDATCRDAMIQAALLPKLMATLNESQNNERVVLSLMYHLSLNDKHKPLFGFVGAIPLVMKMLFDSSATDFKGEVISLAINLACNVRNAELMCENNGLKFLLKLALKENDALLLKIVRNISIHDADFKSGFLPFVDKMATKILDVNTPEHVLVELLSILANITIKDFDYAMLVKEFNMVPFFTAKFSRSACPDDILFQSIKLLGTLLSDGEVALLLSNTRVIPFLVDLLEEKQEDDEMVLQLVYVFYRLLMVQPTRNFLLSQTQVVNFLLSLLHDKNKEIRAMCDRALDVVADYDEMWATKIAKSKFEFHNAQWIESVLGGPDGVPQMHIADDLYSSNPHHGGGGHSYYGREYDNDDDEERRYGDSSELHFPSRDYEDAYNDEEGFESDLVLSDNYESYSMTRR